MARVTIRDIAKVAGVSPSAVSFALNERPGVSTRTRERILDVARDMGWTPNTAARALSARTAGAIGLVIARPQSSFTTERFFFDFMVGLQSALRPSNRALVLQAASDIDEEIAIHRSWWSGRTVDGVVVVDPRQQDPRPRALLDMEMPAVIVGEEVTGLGGVIGDEEGMITSVVSHLLERGRRKIAYVGGFTSLEHTSRRSRALIELGSSRGIGIHLFTATDFTEASARAGTQALLESPDRPDAIIFDNEILTLGGLRAIGAAGLQIGTDIAVVSCEDSVICQVVEPQITAVHRDPAIMGEHASQVLISLLDGEPARVIHEQIPELIIRESSGR